MWMTVKLGDILDLQNGFAFKSKEYTADGYFVMRITNVQQGYISAHNPKYIQIDSSSKLTKFILEEGDILVSLTGDVGRVGVIREEHLPAALNQRVARVQSIDASLDRHFLFHYLNSAIFRNQVEALGKGAAQANVSTKDILEITLELPPLAEQQRIVAKLDAAFAEIDRAIELTNENLHLAEQSTESFLTDIIINADNICHKRLGEACEFSQGVQVPKQEQSETLSDEHPQRFLRIIDFTSEGMEPPRYISQRGKKYHMTENDVALVRYGNPGFVCRGLEGTLANNLFKVIPRTDELDNSYLYYFLKSGLFQRAVRLKAHGVAMQAISFSLISDIELLLPPTEFQKKIVKKAEGIEATLLQLKDYYSEKLHLLERLKSSLLSQELQPPQSEAA
jgi:type I restriction enzyme, S subunit